MNKQIFNKYYVTTLCLLLLLLNSLTYAQQGNPNPNPSLTNVVPPSPNAASLGKFGDVPVGYFTGIPQINVPIYSYKNADNSLGLSISLDYHAGGVRVNDAASNVGMGWALNAGGVITRTVRGIADESGGVGGVGFLYTAELPIESEGNRWQGLHTTLFKKIAAGVWDGQNDLFNYNFGGKSGKFALGKNNDFLLLTPAKIKIEKEISVLSGIDAIKRFIATDESGTKYVFDSLEISSIPVPFGSSVSAWYLTKIIAPFATDSILIDYENEYYTSLFGGSTTNSISLGLIYPSWGSGGGPSGPAILGKRIKRISFPDSTKVDFAYDNTQRTDLSGTYRLKKVTISNGGYSRGYNLYHDYSINRLTLLQVIPFDVNGESTGFSFNYRDALPARFVSQQDHWGFYNNNLSIDFFPHEYLDNPIHADNGMVYYDLPGGSREVDTAKIKYGSLTRMTYPTGGYTEFEMEPNEADDAKLKRDAITEIITHNDGSVGGIYASTTAPVYGNFNFQGDPGTNTSFTISFDNNSGSTNNSLYLEFKNSSNAVVSTQTIPFSNLGTVNASFSIYNLTPGLHKIYPTVLGPDYFENYVSLDYREDISSNPDTTKIHIENPYVGGLRVKSIRDYDGISNNPVSVREYEYLKENSTVSSGTLGVYPVYSYLADYEQRRVCDPVFEDGHNDYYFSTNNFIIRNTSPVQTLESVNGSPVNYTRVVEKFANNGKSNGKIVRYFDSYETNPVVLQAYPFVPPDSKEWVYGQLNKELVFNKDNVLLKKTENEYSVYMDPYTGNGSRVANFKSVSLSPVVFERWHPGCTEAPPGTTYHFDWTFVTGPSYYLARYFAPFSGRKDLTKTRTVEYSNNDSLINEITYTYDTAFNINKTLSKNSRNEQIEEIVHYSYEYTSNTVANAMKAKNMYAPPIATERWKTIGVSKYLTGGIVNQYQQLTSGIRKTSIEAFESTSPVISSSVPAFSAFSFSRSASLFKEAITVNQYSNKGFVAQQAKSNDVPQSIIWDNNGQMPIAQAVNATADKIAYTSFETDGKGNWSFAAAPVADATSTTGNKCYNTASGNITISSLANEGYIVSYWGKTGSVLVNGNGPIKTGRTIGSWTYYEHVITGTSVTISGSKYIDELRLYPVKAEMSTFSYTPLFGLTSQCDANNRITYYEYDGFGRLKLVRDQDRNILKTYDYQFQKNYNQ